MVARENVVADVSSRLLPLASVGVMSAQERLSKVTPLPGKRNASGMTLTQSRGPPVCGSPLMAFCGTFMALRVELLSVPTKIAAPLKNPAAPKCTLDWRWVVMLVRAICEMPLAMTWDV